MTRLAFFAVVVLISPVFADGEEMPRATNTAGSTASRSGTLFIASCSTSVLIGKANLSVSGMRRRPGGYNGQYQIKVTPLSVGSESGQLSVSVDDGALRKLTGGGSVGFTGRAVTSGTGKTRPLTGIATPSDDDEGTVQMWFIADERKVVFNTTYGFGQN